MPISVTCPKCGKRSYAQESAVGKKVKCGNCGTVFIVAESIDSPQPPPAVAMPPVPPPIANAQTQPCVDFVFPNQTPLHSAPASARSLRTAQLFAVTSLASLFVLGGLAYWFTNYENVGAEKFRAVNRASKAMEGAVTTGVSLQKFRDLLQTFATEVAVLEGTSLNSRESECLTLFKASLAIYADSVVIWEAELSIPKYGFLLAGRHYGLTSEGTLGEEPAENAPMLIPVYGALATVVANYQLPLVNQDVLERIGEINGVWDRLNAEAAARTRKEKYIVSTMLQVLWGKAKSTGDRASSLIN